MYSEPIHFKRGNTFRRHVHIIDRQTGSPINVAGYTFWFTVKTEPRKQPDGEAIFTLDNGAITRIDEPNGVIEIVIPDSVTKDFDLRAYYCDVQMKVPSTNDIETPIEFVLLIQPDVTRRTT